MMTDEEIKQKIREGLEKMDRNELNQIYTLMMFQLSG